MENSFAETHKKTLPGSLFGAGDTSLTLTFTQAPLLPEGCMGLLDLSPEGACTTYLTPLPHGQANLSVMVENPILPVNLDDLAMLQNDLGISKESAQHMIMLSQCGELGKSIAQHFFLSARDIEPTLRIRPVVDPDGTTHVQHLQILMTGKPNKHPYWHKDCV